MSESKNETKSSDWPTESSGYELQVMIGEGAFAKVWRAFCPSNGETVAIKIMELENVSSSFDEIRQEVNTMRLADNENVLRCYCSFVHLDQLWLVMQFMDKGSCHHVINRSKRMGMGEGMREEWIAYILHETLQGLHYFHSQGQLHRDVKAGNILLTGNGEVRLADFGVVGWMIGYGERRDTVKTFVGTPCWMAPEVMEQQTGYNEKADVWSFGITALELAKGFAPYAHYPPMKVLLMTIQEDSPSLRTYEDDKQITGDPFSRGFKDIVRLCLQKDPKKRPSCQTLLANKFFKNVRGRESLVSHLQSIESVGEGAHEQAQRPVGTQPGFAHISSQGTSDESKGLKLPPENLAPGTTWVFEDGSSMIVRKSGDGENEDEDDDDGLNEFASDFKAATTGESHR
mmetsp:Transcript_16026/g.21181  ORF Transcript_16026/g.21181 Transcript_16026/m.21181 type:complete len:401 (+) Transcript_16026:237-1439(+)|eukprot:CAMPEP_0117756336 /NCGR_PEP_ID=MMETSP0947-20121206/14012_1 /TAXON_ID=44440 /ORGANISM="Chattonella subsalsa, Strain CCMP2191" /LENGTH=400 /DNA_ID=CAMNT_0005575893 /DNA_START=237 /DNA_END=1439 /DNA_ORIENTATION=+